MTINSAKQERRLYAIAHKAMAEGVGVWMTMRGLPITHKSPDAIVEPSSREIVTSPPSGAPATIGKSERRSLPEFSLPPVEYQARGDRDTFKDFCKTGFYEVDGAVLRNVILRLIKEYRSDDKTARKGLIFSNLLIEGKLDLSRLELPFSIRFRHCQFRSIEARYTQFRTLDISNCVIGTLNATFCEIKGNFRCVATRFLGAVDFGGVVARRVFDMRRSYILPRLSQYRHSENRGKRGNFRFVSDRNVLNLSLGQFDMDVRLTEMVIIGGVSITGSTVLGSIFLNRAKVLSPFEAARNLSHYKKLKNLDFFRRVVGLPPDLAGEWSTQAIHQCTPHEKVFSAVRVRPKPKNKVLALQRQQLEKRLDEYLNEFVDEFLDAAKACAILYIFKTAKQFEICISGRTSHSFEFSREIKRSAISAFRAQELTVRGNIYMRESRLLGTIRLRGVRVEGIFNANALELQGPPENLRMEREPTQTEAQTVAMRDGNLLQVAIPAFYAPFSKVGGDCDLAGAKVVGAIDLSHADIGGTLSFVALDWRPSGSVHSRRFQSDESDKWMSKRLRRDILRAKDIKVGGDLLFARYSTSDFSTGGELYALPKLEASWAIHPQRDGFPRRGYVIDLIGADIQGDFVLSLDHSRNPRFLPASVRAGLDWVSEKPASHKEPNQLLSTPQEIAECEAKFRWDVRLQGQAMTVGRRFAIRGRWVDFKPPVKEPWSGGDIVKIPVEHHPIQRLRSTSRREPFQLDFPWPTKEFSLKEYGVGQPRPKVQNGEPEPLAVKRAPLMTVSLANASVKEFEFERSVWPLTGWLELSGLTYRQLGRFGPLHFFSYVDKNRGQKFFSWEKVFGLSWLQFLALAYITAFNIGAEFYENKPILNTFFEYFGPLYFAQFLLVGVLIFVLPKAVSDIVRDFQLHMFEIRRKPTDRSRSKEYNNVPDLMSPEIMDFFDLQSDLRRPNPDKYVESKGLFPDYVGARRSLPTQPHTVAARALKNQGFSITAMRILRAREFLNIRGTRQLPRYARIALGHVFGHGLDLMRVGALLVVMILASAATTEAMLSYGATFSPTDQKSGTATEIVRPCPQLSETNDQKDRPNGDLTIIWEDSLTKILAHSATRVLPLLDGSSDDCRLVLPKDTDSEGSSATVQPRSAVQDFLLRFYSFLYAAFPSFGWLFSTVLLFGIAARIQAALSTPEY